MRIIELYFGETTKKLYVKTFYQIWNLNKSHKNLTFYHTEFFHTNKSINDVEIVNLAFQRFFD